MQSIIESGKLYLDPDVEVQRFLVPFVVGTNKIKLYGHPDLMMVRSELVKSLIDKLSLTQDNPLAINQNVDSPNGLIIVWLYICNVLQRIPLIDPNDYLAIWYWLNYFDVPYKSEFVTGYLRGLADTKYLTQLVLPENKELRDDILRKTKVIDSKLADLLSAKIAYETRDKSYDIELRLTAANCNVDKFIIDGSKRLPEELGRAGITVLGSPGIPATIFFNRKEYTWPVLSNGVLNSQQLLGFNGPLMYSTENV